MSLHTFVEKKIRDMRDMLHNDGKLLSNENLAVCYKNFRDKFGPDILRSLDGEALLDFMHSHATKDSLVYWLEFKDDKELPAIFGSIAGGSALKFCLYKRKETGKWMTGHPSNQRELTVEEAIGFARKHRDQLINGDDLLKQMPGSPSFDDYVNLQNSLDKEAPDVSTLAWGHKYFSLLHPHILDDFHSPVYQRYMLTRMLQKAPSDKDGRYIAAYTFQQIAKHLGMHINHLTYSLNELYGNPYSYWRVGTTDGYDSNYWLEMKQGNFISVGWNDLGDLSWVNYNSEHKEELKKLMLEKYPKPAHISSRQSNQLFKFVAEIKEGEVVVAANGMIILGIGKVTGEYYYDAKAEFPHKRPVEWLSLESWQEPVKEGLQTTVHKLGKYPENLLEIERRILEAPLVPEVQIKTASNKLVGIPGRIQSVLERKKQVILYGPPGTGKTYWADVATKDLAALSWYGKPFNQLDNEQKLHIQPGPGENKPVRMCCFHPAYGYEDFLEGYRPELHESKMVFVSKNGIFKQLCEDAQKRPDKNFYLLIDEINRGDIPRIFGELLTILEKDKRGKSITLPLSAQSFVVPANVFVVGTMNTADRSIALLDAALRRRFGFIELMPDSSVLGEAMIEGLPLGPWLDSLNRKICQHVGRDARNLQIGHSYLMDGSNPIRSFSGFARALREDIIPLLEEYCYEDYTALHSILKKLVDVETQQVRNDLFSPTKKDDLVRILLEMDPEIASSPKTVQAEQEALEIHDDSVDDDNDQNVEA
ncbi:AAA family ATPase [Desulfomicrobium sp. ZS1]|uniref:McrB family protein n=1 Tax=Desulfomicrobium sp. ZS1 TaxID=2952228 RepID=UPI0020B29605|nr:AAA family ATPase [Desulfomicrobium sp. ZS1]UTF51802.1 AAA family ATPase [Desulfomicrobium sp. ZS1]